VALWFDTSPLRPDEWAVTDAERWTETVQLKLAYAAGVNAALEAHQDSEAAKARVKQWLAQASPEAGA
jgi:hypothetical protein